MGELKKRVFVALVGIPTVFLVLTNYTACCFLLLISVLLCYREYRMMAVAMMKFATGKEESGYIGQMQSTAAAFFAHLIMPLFCIITVTDSIHEIAWNLIVGLLLESAALMSLRILQYKQIREELSTPKPEEEHYLLPKYRILTFQAICYDYFFMVFISLTFTTGLHILQLQSRAKVLIMWFGATWQTDNGCLLFGKLFGRRKIAQFASPNKTIEGVIGGYLLSFLTLQTLNLLLYDTIMPGLSFSQVAVAAAVFSTTAVVGDLGESFVKRAAAMKDASDLLPGHGGLLDRVDSLCLGCPVAYVLVKAFEIV